MSAEENARQITLEAPEGWEARAGYLTRMSVLWDAESPGSAKTRTLLFADELQAIVNAAAAQYSVRPEDENATTEYAIRYADPYDGSTITEPIGAGSVEGYQRQDWCVVISRNCSGWEEVKP